MYKLLIVDDEAVERQALRMIIRQSFENAQIIGEAENGRRAIELAEREHPDLILMDIKMPGIDGVEAVRIIKKRLPDTKFIMISAFDTFEYARQVMQQGVKEYLLKPSPKKEIINAIHRVLKEIEDERRVKEEQLQLRKKLQKALDFAQSEWVVSLLMNHLSEENLKEWGDVFDFTMRSAFVMVFSLPESTTKSSYAALEAALKNGDEQILISPMSRFNMPSLVMNPSAPPKAVATSILNHFRARHPDVPLRIGVGTQQWHMNKIALSYRQALIALENTKPDALIKCYSDEFFSECDIDFIFQSSQQIIDAMRLGHSGQLIQCFEDFYHQAQQQLGQENKIKRATEELLVLIKHVATDMGIEMKNDEAYYSAQSVDQWRRLALKQIAFIAAHFDDPLQLDVRETMVRAKQHIDDHYYMKNLSLEETAEHVGLSPFYFSKLFKETFHMNYIDYLTHLRIEKAKELIRNPENSLKEICFDVGYRDPNYFSRVFKKVVGISPSEYRKSLITKK